MEAAVGRQTRRTRVDGPGPGRVGLNPRAERQPERPAGVSVDPVAGRPRPRTWWRSYATPASPVAPSVGAGSGLTAAAHVRSARTSMVGTGPVELPTAMHEASEAHETSLSPRVRVSSSSRSVCRCWGWQRPTRRCRRAIRQREALALAYAVDCHPAAVHDVGLVHDTPWRPPCCDPRLGGDVLDHLPLVQGHDQRFVSHSPGVLRRAHGDAVDDTGTGDSGQEAVDDVVAQRRQRR